MNAISYWINLYYGALCQNSVDFCQGGNNYPGSAMVACIKVINWTLARTLSQKYHLVYIENSMPDYLSHIFNPHLDLQKSGKTAAHVKNLPVPMPFIILLPRINMIWGCDFKIESYFSTHRTLIRCCHRSWCHQSFRISKITMAYGSAIYLSQGALGNINACQHKKNFSTSNAA